MEARDVTGIVTDIQRFSLHDGPGIRTSVFLKGCNMDCAWCHNPETIHPWPEIILDPDRCIHCGKCADGCYSGARRPVGREMTAEAVLLEVLRDQPYYAGGGGVTLTGGEPTFQPKFAAAILDLAKGAGIHRAMETNLLAPGEVLLNLAARCGLVMCDLKLWDEELHRHFTGTGNRRILENLRALDGAGVPLMVRTPLVAGVNDDDACVESIAKFLGALRHLQCYELLPYNALGLSKRVEGCPPRQKFERPSPDRVRALACLAQRHVKPVRIAGRDIEKERRA